jgi:lysophospholipase L1-like esterase
MKIFYKVFLLLSLQIFFSAAFAKNACLDKQLKIVAIGDSITQGGGNPDEYTYRLPLSKLLKDAGYDVDFIGTQRSGLDKSFKWPTDFDNDHEGFYGQSASSVAQKLKTDLIKLPAPDFALIHLAGCGCNAANVINSVVMPMRSIISQLRKRNPKVHILISQIHLNGFRVKYIRFHLNLLAKYESTAISPVITVPDYEGWTDNDTLDGMHPSLSGQKKMAKAWFKSINSLCNPNKSKL